MRVVLTLHFIALLLTGGGEGRSWRAIPSSPLVPFVIGKDFINARSLSSLASTAMKTCGGSGSESQKVSVEGARTDENDASAGANSDPEKANNLAPDLSDDVARGGDSTKTRVKSEDEDTTVETATTETEMIETPDEAVVVAETDQGQKVESVAVAETPGVKEDAIEDKVRPSRRELRRRRRKEKKELHHSAAKYAKKLKNRNTLNIRRKIMHVNFGLFFAALNHFIPKERFVPGMAVLTTATLAMELLRYRKYFGWMNHALHFVLGSSLRKHEMEGKFTGSFYFFLGVTVTSALYPTTCATLGICQLALADPSASFFGRQTRHVYWSRIEGGLGGFGRNKGVLGFLGGALFCFPFNYRVLSIAKFGAGGVPGGNQALVFASLALGFAGAFADLAVPTPALTMPKKVFGVPVPPLHVDDNFVVPIVSGFACTRVFKMLDWPLDLQLSKFIIC